jgi:hypothetical protein
VDGKPKPCTCQVLIPEEKLGRSWAHSQCLEAVLWFRSRLVFGHQNPGARLEPDSREMLDPDPDSMNPDPQFFCEV